jgi:hypothetical protein
MPDEASSTHAQPDDAAAPGIAKPWGHAPDTEDDPAAKAAHGLVHPGWSAVPDEAFALGQSGGWGGPDHALTGPIPIIRGRELDREGTVNDEADEADDLGDD